MVKNRIKVNIRSLGKMCFGMYQLSLLYFIYLMILITLQYIPIDQSAAFLAIKTEEVRISYYPITFYLHVFSSIFVLILGFIQFIVPLQNLYPRIHRGLGKAYIILILSVAAPSGLVMGIHGNGGIYSQIAFCLLALLWFYFTLMGFLKIKDQKIQLHKEFMLLSFALTLSAVSLRMFKWIIVHTFALPPMDTYKIVVWLGWIFNLIVALLIIRYRRQKSPLPKAIK